MVTEKYLKSKTEFTFGHLKILISQQEEIFIK